MMSLAEFGEASGQKSDLIQRIKDILEQYAEGTPVLKELLQNSDDAGATEVVVCLDKRRHSSEKLADPGLSKYVGPGILFFNNANFADSDWEALLNIGKSSKKEDTLKTGRFGVGFCSVYHVTDLPSVVSGTRLEVLDPQLSLESVKKNPSKPGIKIPFGNANLPSVRTTLFEPYRQFCNFDPCAPFQGTIIRLPLREQGSEISAEIYTPEIVGAQFHQFQQEAVEMLLFLRCLKNIRIIEWRADEVSPSLIYECSVTQETALIGDNAELYKRVQEWRWKDDTAESYIFDVKKEIKCRLANGETTTQTWLVCSTLTSPSDVPKEKWPKDPKLRQKLIPFVGVAARAVLPDLSVEAGEHSHAVKGAVYCSLPLPIHTKLPVHINARFAITLDRRNIWEEQGEKANWNDALLSIVIPQTYLRLLASFPNENVFSLFPVESATSFASLQRALYNLIESSDEKLAPIKNLAEEKYTSLRDVLLLNPDEVTIRLAEILGKFEIPACLVPHGVLQAMQEHTSLQFIDPVRVREYFRPSGTSLSVDDGLFVLNHYAADITPENIDQLYGLPLLPTASSTAPCKIFKNPAEYSPEHSPEQYYFSDQAEYELLSKFEATAQCLVSNQIPLNLVNCVLASDCINVRKTSSLIMAELVALVLPKSCGDIANVDGELCGWIQCLWQDYLTHIPKLDDFEGLFLLSSPDPKVMCKITRNSRFFFRSVGEESISEDLANILQTLGCQEVTTIDAHLFENHYVLRPTPSDILLALKSALEGINLDQRFGPLSHESIATLLQFLSTQSIARNLIPFVQKLPIFRTHSGEFGPAESVYLSPPADQIHADLLLGLPEFLDIPTESHALARALGAQEITTLEFYEKFVFPRVQKLESTVRDSAMLKLLRSLSEIKDSGFLSQLARLAFVPTVSGTLHSPTELYDLQAPFLHFLLPEHDFPTTPFVDEDTLVYLRQLGLQTSLSAHSLMKLSSTIGEVPKAKTLLDYLNANSQIVTSDKELQAHLCATAWMPVLESRQFTYPDFPHVEVTGQLQAPAKTRAVDSELLLSSFYFLLDGTLDPKLKEVFGWKVTPQDVFDQLLRLSELNLKTSAVGKLADAAYRILSRAPKGFISKVAASDKPWIWCGTHTGFVTPNQTAFHSKTVSSDLLPTLPESYAEEFSSFFASCGVPEYFSTEAYISSLSKFAVELGPDNELHEKDLKWIVSVLNEVASDGKCQKGVFIPTESKYLRPSNEVYFDDAKWAPGYKQKDSTNMAIVHHTISNEVASMLGALSRRKFLLSQSSGVFGAHGQRVTLINTIKRKLVDYPEGAGILKEMVQNADDSGATKMIVVWDKRTHGTTSLVSNELKDFQGPALCVYNDSVFSDKDYENIQNIENSYKQGDSNKIGKYGVGFNSVYHLTDVPSFVSRDKLIIFDPHTRHLPDIDGNPVPGMEIWFAKAQFEDQFHPYRMLGCTMKETFNGTLFRFPLRTAQQASASEIKKEPFTPSDMDSMVQAFTQIGGELLLHLNNVREFEVYTWEAGDDAPSLIWQVRSQKERYEQLTEAEFHYAHITSTHYSKAKSEESTSTWAIVTGTATSGNAFNFAKKNSSGSRRFSPNGAVSVKLRDNAGTLFPDTNYSGKVYTFLPLPEEKTGLCCNVHGPFEIKSSRSGLEWNEDASRKDLDRTQWNRILIADVILKLYQCLMFSLRDKCTPEVEERYYRMLDLSNISTTWKPFRKAVLEQLWVVPFLRTKSPAHPFTSPRDALFPDAKPHTTIEALLIHMEEPLVGPAALKITYKQFAEEGHTLRTISAKHVVATRSSDPTRFQLFFSQSSPEDALRNVVSVLEFMRTEFTSDSTKMLGFPVVTRDKKLAFIALATKNIKISERLFLCNNEEIKLVPPCYHSLVVCKEVQDVLPAGNFSQKLNIHPLNGRLLSQLLRPELEKLGDATFVELRDGQHTFLTKEWFTKFWDYAQQRVLLEDFEGMFIVPVSNGVCKLVRSSPVICDDTLTAERIAVLFKISCFVVEPSCANKIRANPQWTTYFYPNTFDGILQAIHATKTYSDLNTLFSNLSPSDLLILKTFLISKLPQQLSDSSRKLLQSLPLLHTNHQGTKKLTAFSRELWIPAKMFTELRKEVPSITHGPFVLGSSDDYKLADAMGFSKLGDEHFIRELMNFVLAPAFPVNDRDRLNSYILNNLQSTTFKAHHKLLAQFPFVPTTAGEKGAQMRKPSELYHPTKCREAAVLLQDPCCFPSENFASLTTPLVTLHMSTSYTPQVLERVVDQISGQPSSGTSRARGVKLLELLSENTTTYSPEKFPTLFEKMKKQPCIPTLKCPSDYPAELWKCTAPMVPAAEARPFSMANSVSSAYNIVDVPGIINTTLQKSLGWSIELSPVFQQAAKLQQVRDKVYAEKISEIAQSIYSMLNTNAPKFSPDFIENLKQIKFVFIEDHMEYVSARQLALASPFPGVQPYLFAVPKAYTKHMDLWLKLGVPKTFSVDQLLDLLQSIKTASPTVDDRTMPLVVAVCEHIAEQKNLSDAQKQKILVPTIQNTLVSPQNCVCDLDENLPLYMEQKGYSKMYQKLTLQAAKRLGVLPPGEAALYSTTFGGNMRSFGQHTSLVNDIQKITHDYPERSVLSELIQNADDAGATEIHFIHDLRQHATKKLFGESMKAVQGESLLVYNNKQFSDLDFKNISEVASASKASDISKTGKFGVGFVSTYHLTDTPSFLSGDQFCIFDPLCNYVPIATQSNPGVRCTLEPSFVAGFSDQFEPFEVLGCVPGKTFQGTIFRFPIRKKPSKLKPSSNLDMAKLLRDLDNGSILLFLKNIRKITVSQYRTINGKEEKKVMYSMEKQVTHFPVAEKTGRIPQLRLVDSLVPNFLDFLANCKSATYAKTTTEETITIQKGDKATSQAWLVCSNISAHKDLVNFIREHQAKRVPWGGVAVPIGPSDAKAQAFYFLPLTLEVPFAVSINGFFEVPSNRQTIIGHQSSKESDEAGKWNELLIRRAIAQSYISLLQAGAALLEQSRVNVDWYISLFPSVPKNSGFWSDLAAAVYELIGDQKLLPTDPRKNLVGAGGHVIECSKALYSDIPIPEDVTDFVVRNGRHAFCALPATIAEKVPNLQKFDAAMCCDLLTHYVGYAEKRIDYGQKGVNSDQTVLENETEVLALFSFCYTSGCKQEMVGLPLFPLASGKIGVVGSTPLFLNHQADLLPRGKHFFVTPTTSNHMTISCRMRVEDQTLFKLQYLTNEKLADLLQYAVPADWKNKSLVLWNQNLVSAAWLDNFWKFVDKERDFSAFGAWPLVPTNNGLVKLKNASTVLALGSACPAPVRAVLERTGCHIFSPQIAEKFPTQLLSTPSSSGICNALGAVSGIEDHQFNAEEADILRQCLEDATKSDLPVLKMLRIFPDTLGRTVAIGDRSWKAVTAKVDSEIELEEAFLVQKDAACKQLYERCQIPRLTTTKFHNHILRNWNNLVANLSDDKQFECLDIVRTTILKKTQKRKQPTETINLLREIRFVISDKEGAPKKKPSKLYDPRVGLFAASFEKGEGKFPGKQYATEEWLDFLQTLGLLSKPSEIPITATETCAESICEKITEFFHDPPKEEQQFHTKLNELKSRATVLMRYVAHEKRASEKLQTLPYAVTDSAATQLPCYCGENIHFASYENATLKFMVDLVWLHRPALITAGDVNCARLQRPTVAQIIDNLLEFCTSIAPKYWTHDSLHGEKIKQVVAKIYRDLSFSFMTYKSSDAGSWDKLRHSKWILVESDNEPVFACPTEIFEDLPEAFPGYLYKLPRDWLECRRMFAELGMRKEPTCTQIIAALASKARAQEEVPLDPNEFITTKKLLEYLASFDNLAEERKDKIIYAPDTALVLRDISQLISKDAPLILHSIDSAGANMQFLCDILPYKAGKLGAKSLFKVVSVLPDLEQLGKTTIHHEYTQKISCDDFVACVTRIASAGREHKDMERYYGRITDLRGVKVMQCEMIVNQFIHKETKNNIANPDAKRPQQVAVDVHKKIIYVAANYDEKKVAINLTEKLNDLLGGAVKKNNLLYLTELLQSAQETLIEVCDGFNIPAIAPTPTICPGEVLTQHHLQSIKDNLLYTFIEGEYVAWRDPRASEEIYRYGIIRKVLSQTVVINLASIISTKYEVEVGHGTTKEFGVINLYKFRSKNETEEEDQEEEEEGASRMQQLLNGNSDEYFSKETPEEKQMVAERIFKATLADERFKQSSGVVDSFVTHQLHHVAQVRKKKLKLSNSNSNNNNRNNRNQNNYAEDEAEREYRAQIVEQWKQQHEFKTSLSFSSSQSNDRPNLQYAERGINQVRNDVETMKYLQTGNDATMGNMSDAVCFFAQQIMEKALKAAIVCTSHSPHVLRDHNLANLIAHCDEEVHENDDILRAVDFLDSFYLPTRYFEHHSAPFVTRDGYTKLQADEAVDIALRAVDYIISYVQRKLTS